jgi:hypothetical protein
VSEAQAEFNEDVVEVNRGLAVAYHQHDRERVVPETSEAGRLFDEPARIPAAWELPWSTDHLPKERF